MVPITPYPNIATSTENTILVSLTDIYSQRRFPYAENPRPPGRAEPSRVVIIEARPENP